MLISISILPLFIFSTNPFFPNTASLTLEDSGSIVIQKLASLAASFGEFTNVTPSWSIFSIATDDVSYTFNLYPFLIRQFAIGNPIVPSPIKPIFIVIFVSLRLN